MTRLHRALQPARARRGAAVVEMAIIAPLFFLLVLGIIEFGRAMSVAQLITTASREGARLAAVPGSTNTSVTTRVKEIVSQTTGVAQSDVSVNIAVTPAPGNPDPGGQIGNSNSGDAISIAVSVPFNKVQYTPGDYLSGKNLTAATIMRRE